MRRSTLKVRSPGADVTDHATVASGHDVGRNAKERSVTLSRLTSRDDGRMTSAVQLLNPIHEHHIAAGAVDQGKDQ